MEAGKGEPRVAATRYHLGANQPRANAHAATKKPTVSSCGVGDLKEAESKKNGTIHLEGPVRRWLSVEEGRRSTCGGPKRHHSHLVTAFHHPAAIRWPYIWRI